MIPQTPQEWFTLLSERLRSRHIRLWGLERYVIGDAPLPEGATEVKEAYARWQQMARTDFASLAVDACAERLTIAGFRVGDESGDNDAARDLWTRSRMESASNDVLRDMLIFGVAYAMASPSKAGAILTRESPYTTIVDTDPLIPSRVRAGLKMWHDIGADFAVLHLPGRIHYYERPATQRSNMVATPSGMLLPSASNSGWQDKGSAPSGLDVVPIVQFLNRGGLGEFELHTDLLDRINWVILQRLLITAMQAFRQRAVKGELPEKDADGNVIDYEAMFTPGPDALWTLPDGVDIWESQPGDIQQSLNAAKDDIGQYAAVTRTPMATLMPGDGQNQTAEGAAFAREGLTFKVEDKQRRTSPDWNALVSTGLTIDKKPAEVQVQWAPAERQSLSERFDALTKAGDLPWRDRMTDVLGYDGARVDQMEINRARDAEMATPETKDERKLSVAEMVQKLYLGVGVVISAQEARQIIAESGADIDPNADFKEDAPLPSVIGPTVVEVPDTENDAEDATEDPEDEPSV